MEFREYAEAQRKKAFGPTKKITMRTFEPAEETPIPHEPGSMSQASVAQRAESNQSRATNNAGTGEVLGEDYGSGEAIVRSPGNRLVRVSTGETAVPGQQVSVRSSSPNEDDYQRIRNTGSVISKQLTSSTGWKRAENGSNGFRPTSSASFTIRREVADAGLLSDDCTPPDVRLRILEDAINNGLYLDAQGNIIGGAADGIVPGWGDQIAGYDALYDAYKAAKESKKQEQSLPTFLSLDELGGEPTLAQQFQPGVPLFWSCVNGTCVQSADGFYPTKELCEAQCRLSSFSCINGSCVEVDGLTGQFKTRDECLSSGCATKFDCIGGECVPTPNGQFPTLDSCQSSGCFWGFNCIGGECVPAQGGAFKTLACCQQNCQPLGPATAYISSEDKSIDVLGVSGLITTRLNNFTTPPIPDDPNFPNNRTAFETYKRNLDPGEVNEIEWVSTGGNDDTGAPVMLMFSDRAEHRFTIDAEIIMEGDPPEPQQLLLDHWIRLSQYYPAPDSVYGVGTWTPYVGSLGQENISPQDTGISVSGAQSLGSIDLFDGWMEYGSAVTSFDQVVASTPLDGLPFFRESGIPLGEGDIADEGFTLQTVGAPQATVTNLGNQVYQLNWTGVQFVCNSARQDGWHRQSLRDNLPTQPWFSAADNFCVSGTLLNTFTGLNAARDLVNQWMVLPGWHWTNYSAYTINPFSSNSRTSLTITISSDGPPKSYEDMFPGWTHPTQPQSFYPWTSQRNNPIWTNPEYSQNSLDNAQMTC